MSDRHQFKSTIVNENVSTWSKIEMCYVSRRQEKAWCSGLGFLGPWWSLIIESWWQQGVQGQASCKVQWSSATNYTNYHLSWDVGRQMLCEACGQKSYATSYLRRSATQLWATWQTDPARLLLTVVWLPGKMMVFLSSDDCASSSFHKMQYHHNIVCIHPRALVLPEHHLQVACHAKALLFPPLAEGPAPCLKHGKVALCKHSTVVIRCVKMMLINDAFCRKIQGPAMIFSLSPFTRGWPVVVSCRANPLS